MAKQVRCCALLLISILTFAATAQCALEVVNQLQKTEITVFTPPQCKPCECKPVKRCFCPALCIERTGTVVAPGSSVSITLDKKFYPLAFLTVEVGGVAYNVGAGDLKRITSSTTLVVTGKACSTDGIEAILYENSKLAEPYHICLLPGMRYGS